MHLRKGRLGRSMKGLYVPIQMEKNIPDVQTPSIQREGMSKDILLLKSIGIDIEKLENLPDKPIESSMKTALDSLVYIGAIDEKTQKITDFGREILRFPFI